MRSSECIAIAIDTATGQLALSEGAPYLVRGAEAVRVLAWAAVRCGRDEFFTDLGNLDDLPLSPSASVSVADAWLGGTGVDVARISAQYRRTLSAIPGVGSIRSLRVEPRARRSLLVEAVLVTAFDDIPATEVVI